MRKRSVLITLSLLPWLGSCFAIDTFTPTGPFCHFKELDDLDNGVSFPLSDGVRLNTEFGLFNSGCETLLSKAKELEYLFLLGYGSPVNEYSLLYRVDVPYENCSYSIDKKGSFCFLQETEIYLEPELFDSKESPMRIVFASTMQKTEPQKTVYTKDEISVHIEVTFWFDVSDGVVTLKNQNRDG